jgi:ankyrin repeat protein
MTAFNCACANGHVDIVHLLLSCDRYIALSVLDNVR